MVNITSRQWLKKKPKRWKECILITATWIHGGWCYTIYTIDLSEGYNAKDEPAYYWGIFEDGDEWGDIDDLRADRYLMLPPLKKQMPHDSPFKK